MRLLLIAAIAILVGCQSYENIRKATVPSEQSGERPLTVLTFNIRLGYGVDDRSTSLYDLRYHNKSVTPIIEAIRSVDPDIVGLQEVLGSSQAAKIARALDMNYAYQGHDSSGGVPWWGVALLSKFPIRKAWSKSIWMSGSGSGRRMLLTEMEIDGTLVTAASIHVDPALRGTDSFISIRNMAKSVQSPVLLIGDFNTGPSSSKIGLLLDKFVDTGRAVKTENSKNAIINGTVRGRKRIDFVFAEKGRFDVRDAGILSREHYTASDHNGYYAKLVMVRPAIN